MIRFTEGDLFGCGISALAHGVNCQGSMGAGIAVQFRTRWPLMYAQYQKRCHLGQLEPGDCWTWKHPEGGGVVFNLATQHRTGADAHPWMIAAATGRMIQEAAGPHGMRLKEIALPLIGCGIGGLTPADLLAALSPYRDAPVDLVIVTLPEEAPGEPGRQ